MREADAMKHRKKIGRDAFISVFAVVSFLLTSFILCRELNSRETAGILTGLSVCSAMPYGTGGRIEKYILPEIDADADTEISEAESEKAPDNPDGSYSDNNERYQPSAEINGKNAQVMIITGRE